MFLGEYLAFPALMWGAALGVGFSDALKTAVCEKFGVFVQVERTATLFKYLEVMLPPLAVVGCKDVLAAALYKDLALVRVTLFLPRVIAFLFFWGAQLVTQQCLQ